MPSRERRRCKATWAQHGTLIWVWLCCFDAHGEDQQHSWWPIKEQAESATP